jgi:hypothetical protein
MSETHVRVENPETGGVWDCPVDYLPVAKARGWVESDKPLAGEGEEYPQPAADALGEAEAEDEVEFDPGEHTVAEVQDYLEANPDDADRVLDAERAGKKRVGVADAVAEARADDDE